MDVVTILPSAKAETEGAYEPGGLQSPSQITTFADCERKWGWSYIAKIKAPPQPSALLGTRVHAVLETYLRDGKRPDFLADKQAAEIASSGLHLLPAPQTEGMSLEGHFRIRSERTGIVYQGYKDVSIAPGVPVPSLGFDGSAPIVLDHKTTSSIERYAKKASDLEYDAQASIYALEAMTRYGADAADLGWVYYQTKGPSRTHPTTMRMGKKHALRVFSAVEDMAVKARDAFREGKAPLDLEPNPTACNAYGGCPYRHLCKLTPSQLIKGGTSMSIIANLRKQVEAAAAAEAPMPMAALTNVDTGKPGEAPAQITELPKWMTEGAAPGQINPPEAELPPPQAADLAPEVVESPVVEVKEVKAKKGPGRPKKDPKGADVATYTTEATMTLQGAIDMVTAQVKLDAFPVQASADIPAKEANADTPVRLRDEQARELAERLEKEGRTLTLYVDCVAVTDRVFERPFPVSDLVKVANERIEKETGACDYRLIEYGKGAPMLVGYVVEQLKPWAEYALDSRTPEGGVLLEALTARACRVIRGFR